MCPPGKKTFQGASAFQNAQAWVDQHAQELVPGRREGSIAAARQAIEAARAERRVRQQAAREMIVTVYLDEYGDFEKIVVRTTAQETLFTRER